MLHQCEKKSKNEIQNAFAANSYVCRSYRGKSGSESFGPPDILNMVNFFLMLLKTDILNMVNFFLMLLKTDS